MACGVVLSSRGSRRRRLLKTLQRHPGQEAPRVILGRSWLRVRCMELSGMRITFRRYLPHAVIGWLLTRRKVSGFCRRLPRNRLVRRFWGAGQWRLYVQHRFTTPSFLAARAALGLLHGRDGLILDAPCGMGHLSHYLAKMTDPARIVAMDVEPEFAYAARRFFIPNAGAVVAWDMNEPLPLKDGSVGAIFCVDAFHYVAKKRALANEFIRVLSDNGVLAILHLHNRLQINKTPGTPLSPDEYADLFRGNVIRMYPEDYFLNAQIHNEPIDLMLSAPPEDLEKANALVLIVAKNAWALSELTPTRSLLADQATNPQLSGFYTQRRSGGKIIRQLSVPPTLQDEFPNIGEIFPKRSISAESPTVARGPISIDQRMLLEHNVLVDLPENY
jgi:SAM-dependent methyltransferase